MLRSLFACLVALAVLGLTAPTHAQIDPAHVGPGPLHKLLVPASDRDLDRARASEAVVFEQDYGHRTLLILDERVADGAELLLEFARHARDEHDLIPVAGGILDGARPGVLVDALDPRERLAEWPQLDPTAGLYLVQFIGPVTDEWLVDLHATGAHTVQHQPMNAFVVSARTPAVVAALQALRELPTVQHVGVWQPAFRIDPRLRAQLDSGAASLPTIVQLVDDRGAREALAQLRAVADDIGQTWRAAGYVNVEADLHPSLVRALARLPEVFWVQTRGTRALNDERQGVVSAGNVTAGGPSSPNYLTWLAGEGFNSSQFGSFSVNVVDDAYFLTGHPDLPNGRIDFSLNPTSQSGNVGGHGFLNAHIVAGFNDSTSGSLNDSGGYNYGLGIAPWAHVGSTAIFGPGGASSSSWESQAYNNGARISTNSWTYIDGSQNPIPDYDANAQTYDAIVRDARSSQGGNQEYMVLFSAGNDGPSGNTVSTPATAKNVLTVGAGENDRTTGTDGCGVSNSGANDVDDIISFSSQGPVDSSGGDGRWKPEIVSQGTHVQAGVPQSSYNGSSVCNQYWPGGQTLYGWSSGTSHSTPAVAGGAALVRQWFLNEGRPAPSPAMNKAVLVGTAEYMNGVLANDTLPSNVQGMGRMNFGRAFDGTAQLFTDQSDVLTGTGDSHLVNGVVSDSGEPFRVTLAWTDAPGSTSGAPWVNDLDLTVNVGGATYRGNVFSGATSVTGGSHDVRNNVESVFLPAGLSGAFTVTVDASSIGGDGVPGNGDGTDQDFALFIHNGSLTGGPVPPTANFSADVTSGVVPLTVNFSDQSTGTVDTWAWTFGDGGSSSAPNPSHTYTSTGTYTVALTASGPAGSDGETKVGYITVNAAPPPGVSDGSFESQAANSAPTSPWSVTFGSGHVINPAGVSSDLGFASDGSQWAELAADSTNNAAPPGNPGGVTSPPSGGAGISQSFSYASGQTVLEFDASFLRNEDPNSQYNDWMSVDVSDGSTTYNVFYKDTTSTASATSSKYGYASTVLESVSADLAVLFPSSSTSTVFTLTAQVGNGTDDFQPSKGYIDDVRLTGTVSAPVAEFSGTPTSGTAPLNVSFSDQSSGTVTSWAWTFGDGGSSTAQNPSHTYNTPGTYTVTLTATGPGGSDGETKTNYITVNEPAPVADFSGTPTSGTAPLDVDFTDLTTGAVTTWSWNFGDGGASSAQNPTHTYTTPGTYNVTLSVIGPGGLDSELKSAYITVNEPAPVADFSGTPTSGTAPLNVSFSDQSSGTVTSWSWTFGDGGTSTAQNPSHTYNDPGSYTVTLTATGPGGSDGEAKTNYITVNEPAPVAEFSGTPTSGTAPLDVDFTDLTTGAVTTWSWTFGDGGTSTAQNPSHTYNTPGTYTVTLTATGPGGVDGESKVSYITVNEPAPVADFSGTPTSGTSPLNVSFSDLSTGTVTAWSWTFGDGGTSTAQNPSHTYNDPGTYTVTLSATGPGGSDGETKSAYITVNEPAPVADFSGTPTSGTAPLNVDFTDLTTGAVTTWSWNFGDGGASSAQNPSHTYTTPGTYNVTLSVIGPGGLDSELKSAYITVNEPAPVADFSGTPTSGTSPLNVSFSDLSTGVVTSWSWTFGDGGTSTAQNPSHTYNTPGTYTVTLTATGPGGVDGETKSAYITVNEPAPVAEFSGTPTSGTAPLNVSFSDLSTGTVTAWSWTFGDGGTSTAQNPSHTYNDPGTYTVTLSATGPGGSDGETKSAYITVNEPAPVADFSGTPTSGTAPLNVDFTDLTTGAVTTWSWNFGDGGASSAQNPSHTYTTPGTYNVTLSVIGPGGLDSELKSAYITVNEPAPVADFSGTPTSGTSPLNVSFSDLSTGVVTSWSWTFGDGGTSTAQNPSHTYNTPGTYTVTLTATGPGGVDGETKSAYITVNEPAPVAEFSGTPTSGTAPLDVNFTDLTTGAVTSWSWTFGDGGTSTAQNPSHTYNTPGTYTVTLTATGPGGVDGETKSAYITVNEPAPVADFSATPTSGTSPLDVDFSDLSSGGPITSWSWTFGDGGTSTAQNPSHTYTTHGTYSVTLTVTGPGGVDSVTMTDLIDVDAPILPFEDLGNGLAGSAGVPLLVGSSSYVPGEDVSLVLSGALANSTTSLVIGISAINAPFKGGVLVPAPDILLSGLPTGPSGTLPIAFPWPAGVPSGFELFYQHWIQDAGTVFGFAASNAVKSVAP